MDHLLLVSALILSGVTSCNGQESLVVTFQMNGVFGNASFTLLARNLTVSVTLTDSLGTDPVTVEIRPIWVDYDVADKCSTAQLGTATPGLTQKVSFVNNTAVVTFPNVDSLVSLEGSSIVLHGTNKDVCATVERRQEEHPSASAQFHGLVQGTVYFRQYTNSSSTRIVSDLYSFSGSYNGTWFISDSCSSVTSATQLNQLISLGQVTIGGTKKETRLSYPGTNITSVASINGKLLLVSAFNKPLVCAVIRIFSERKAVAEFSHGGITGSITFSQASPFDPTKTDVILSGLSYGAKGYHVHLWPTPQQSVQGQDLCGASIVSGHFNPYGKNVTDKSYPAPDSSTDDNYELGDLSSKYGTLENKQQVNITYVDWNLPLFGQNSIIGRSLVIHRNDSTASRWVCTNIHPVTNSVVAAIAVFKYPVIGQIIFMQGENQQETSVFAQLDYNDGRSGTKNHKWKININAVGHDMLLTDETSRCLSTGLIYDPQMLSEQFNESTYSDYCSKNSPLGCKVGDMSGKLGVLNIRNSASSDTAARQFFTDNNLPLTGPYSVVGKSVSIMNELGTSILSCANIQILHNVRLITNFSDSNVNGAVIFSQMAGFGAQKTMVKNQLTVRNNYRLWIYDLPSPVGNSDCSIIGGVFNPFNITQNPSAAATDDKYMVGDLTKNEKMPDWSSFNLPLTGPASIIKRSLVVTDPDNQNKILACANINSAPLDPSQYVESVSTFAGRVSGTVQMFQTVYTDGTMSDTSILVDLNNQDGHLSQHHNWHTHVSFIKGDAMAEQSPCMSAGVHYDPFMTIKNSTNTTNYVAECKPVNPYRCELGDQSSKLSPYNVGGGRKLYTDVDLPLAGEFSVQGRSMVLHVQERGAARLACADIIPVTGDFLLVELKSTNILDRRNIAEVYAKAIMADPTNIVVEVTSESNEVSKFKVHFLGFQRTELRNKFAQILNEKDKSILSPYIPYISSASEKAVSALLLIAVIFVQLVNHS